jgi:hypothetical protein
MVAAGTHRRTRTLATLGVCLALAACGSRELDPYEAIDFTACTAADIRAPGVERCANTGEGPLLDRACILGCGGKVYDPYGVVVLPSNNYVGVFFSFKNGYEPKLETITSEGTDPALLTYAGPGRADTKSQDGGSSEYVEMFPAYRVATMVERTSTGVVVRFPDRFVSWSQVAVVIDYNKLMPELTYDAGYTFRFYVGSPPQ